MHATSFLVLLAISSFTEAANSFGTLEVTENPCEESQACTPREKCSGYNESIARLRTLPEGSVARTELILQVRKLVCNKERRGVCCAAQDGEPVTALKSNKSHMEDDHEEFEEDVEPDLELDPAPPLLLSGPRPRWAPRASKCCK